MVIQDESLPAAPPTQIRILKRPPSNGILSTQGASTRPAQQPKSLKQREAEYAEARRRILGSASAEEPERDREDLDRLAHKDVRDFRMSDCIQSRFSLDHICPIPLIKFSGINACTLAWVFWSILSVLVLHGHL